MFRGNNPNWKHSLWADGDYDSEFLYIKGRCEVPSDPDACWPWKGATNKEGRPHYKHNGKTFDAHRRMAWINALSADGFWKPFPYDDRSVQVHHDCHNKLCCNPRHLVIVGSDAEHKRIERLERHGRMGGQIFDREEIPLIRALLARGHTMKSIAAFYQVSISTIERIKKGETYSWVD